MMRIKKILVPTDFSEDSEQAARYAAALAKRFEAEVHCVHVVDIPADLVGTAAYSMTGLSEQFMDRIREESKKNLQTFAEKNLLGVAVQTAFLEGSPFLEIIRYAREQQIDLVVIATHGRTGLKHVLFGSVAEKVVRKAPCPVLVVKRTERDFVLP